MAERRRVRAKPDPWGSRCRDIFGRFAPKQLCGYDRVKPRRRG